MSSAPSSEASRALTPLAACARVGGSPLWFEGLLWFTDFDGEALHTVNLVGKTSTLPLAGHRPTGIGFRSDGSLLIISGATRKILIYDGDSIEIFADLSQMISGQLNDMVVDQLGRAYVGFDAPRSGGIVKIDPDGKAKIAAADLGAPRGIAITADGHTLVVAESWCRRVTAYRIEPDGSLSNRSAIAENLKGPPGGIAIDSEGGVWTSLTSACQFERISMSGSTLDRIDIGRRCAEQCTLGGFDGRVLFMVSSDDTFARRAIGPGMSRVDAALVHIPGVEISLGRRT